MSAGDRTAEEDVASSRGWSRRRLWVFRTGVAFFAVQIVYSLLDASDDTRRVAAALNSALQAPFDFSMPALVGAIERLRARGDGHDVLVGLALEGLLALGVAALWTLCDRRRAHPRLASAVRVVLRYLVAVVMLVYGGFKIVPVQFPVPSTEDLLRPLGERTPMGLLWSFMGVSPAYVVFSGLAEALGGTLLFWRRTTTLGALIVAGVATNVVMLNFAYDVMVKHAAVLLLLASIVLASRDARRLGRMLLLDLSTEAGDEPAFRGGPVLRRVRAVLKPAIVGLAVAGPIAVAVLAGPPAAERVPLQGVYSVERFVRDGVEVPPLLTEAGRWRRLVLGDRGDAVAQTMDDRFARFDLAVDEQARTITLSPKGAPDMRFRYEGAAGQPLRLVGDASPIEEVLLRPLPDATVFRVLR